MEWLKTTPARINGKGDGLQAAFIQNKLNPVEVIEFY
jgi:hypothetical protein